MPTLSNVSQSQSVWYDAKGFIKSVSLRRLQTLLHIRSMMLRDAKLHTIRQIVKTFQSTMATYYTTRYLLYFSECVTWAGTEEASARWPRENGRKPSRIANKAANPRKRYTLLYYFELHLQLRVGMLIRSEPIDDPRPPVTPYSKLHKRWLWRSVMCNDSVYCDFYLTLCEEWSCG